MVTVFGGEPPVSFQYDFISIKGRGGKISSSSGEVISLYEVLEVFTPEITRYMFAGTRPNSEFAISFDLDVLKIYEDYDNCERIYFDLLKVNDKRKAKEARIYELSQVGDIPSEASFQIPFRHLCNLLQLHEGNIAVAIGTLGPMTESQKKRLEIRCACAWNWITTFAPEDFKYRLAIGTDPKVELTEVELKAIRDLAALVEVMDDLEDKEYTTRLYDAAKDNGIDTKEFFQLVYRVMINKDQGPKLGPFIKTCGKEKTLSILKRY